MSLGRKEVRGTGSHPLEGTLRFVGLTGTVADVETAHSKVRQLHRQLVARVLVRLCPGENKKLT
jgi:hypothetical protein